MALTDASCRNATCPDDKHHVRLTDSGGLFLEVTPNGSKRWFWRYKFGDKVRALPLGSYCRPGSKTVAMSLKEARAARDAARTVHQAGTDPLQQRKADKLAKAVSSATTFEAVAREFHGTRAGGWATKYAARWLERMEKDLFPRLGSLPIASITAPMLLDALRRVEKRGANETAHTLRQCAGQVFRYGIQTGRCEKSPAADLHGALQALNVRHMSAIVEPAQAGKLLRSIDGYRGSDVVRAALVLSALLFQRPGNIRAMEWDEVDLEGAMWSIPSAKMKRTVHGKVNGRPHLVPLARQAIEVLRGLHSLTGHRRYVFPSLRGEGRSMSENTIRVALRTMGYANHEMTPHGFRAMARTILAEQVGCADGVIEAQLAHGKSGPLGMAYDRAEFMEQRRDMMQAWADHLDELRAGAQVIAFKTA